VTPVEVIFVPRVHGQLCNATVMHAPALRITRLVAPIAGCRDDPITAG
jgi:hypothetical protein